MNIKQFITVGIAGVAMGAMALDNVEVTDVKARQRYPWNGKVDIDFTLDSLPTEPYQMGVEVFDNVGKTNLPVKSVYTPGVGFAENPTMVMEDTRRIIWDAGKDLPNGFKCTNVLVTCRDSRVCNDMQRYMIVDLSAGPEASTFPISYTNCPPSGGWTEEYALTKLVLRKIEAGSFEMGSLLSESGRQENEDRHVVTLTKPYYIGVFELTEKQFALIYGGSGTTTKPVTADWYTIRGMDVTINETTYYSGDYQICYYSNGKANDYTWPNTSAVASDSLMGKLRAKTGISFDLPTEAQWERACRAGSEMPIYTGGVDSQMERAKIQGDAKLDPTGTHMVYVGLYQPNAYGLYDMQGNAQEWCLDIYVANLGTASRTDPKGGTNIFTWDFNTWGPPYYHMYLDGYQRVIRGGGARSASRSSAVTYNMTGALWQWGTKEGKWSYTNPVAGVRLAVTLN